MGTYPCRALSGCCTTSSSGGWLIDRGAPALLLRSAAPPLHPECCNSAGERCRVSGDQPAKAAFAQFKPRSMHVNSQQRTSPNDPATFQADKVDYNDVEHTVTWTGNVQVWQGDRVLRADKIVYDRDSALWPRAECGHNPAQWLGHIRPLCRADRRHEGRDHAACELHHAR